MEEPEKLKALQSIKVDIYLKLDKLIEVSLVDVFVLCLFEFNFVF